MQFSGNAVCGALPRVRGSLPPRGVPRGRTSVVFFGGTQFNPRQDRESRNVAGLWKLETVRKHILPYNLQKRPQPCQHLNFIQAYACVRLPTCWTIEWKLYVVYAVKFIVTCYNSDRKHVSTQNFINKLYKKNIILNSAGITGYPYWKYKPQALPHIIPKINSKRVIDLNVKSKAIKQSHKRKKIIN